MKIFLLRHGRTADNEQRRYQGARDTPLSPAGEETLERADFSPRQVHVSPLRRARRTAELLFPAVEQQVVVELREMNFGDFEGRSANEMKEDAAYCAWVAGGCLAPCPGGEGRDEFSRRVCAAFSLLVEEALAAGEDQLVIVAHGGVQMAVLEAFARPKRDYYESCGSYGGGYLLEIAPARWQEERVLSIAKTLNYEKGGQPC